MAAIRKNQVITSVRMWRNQSLIDYWGEDTVTVENSLQFLKNLNIMIICNSTLRHIPKRSKNMSTQRIVHEYS